MAADQKAKIDAKLKAHPMKEMTKEVTAFLKKNPALQKKFGSIESSEKVELDKRKWNAKKVTEVIEANVRYDLKILAVRFAKLIKDGENGDPKKLEKALIKEFEDVKKEVLNKASLVVEEIVSGKGDNAKSLKDCKAAFAKLGKVDFDMMYQAPRQEAEEAFNRLAEVLEDKKATEAEQKKEMAEALKTLDICVKEFGDSGKEASDAIDTLLKAAKTSKNDKDVDGEIKSFAETVLKSEGKITSVLSKSKKFSDALDAAQKLLKSGDVSAKAAKVQKGVFAKMSSLDGSAKETLKNASSMERAFKKIESKLK
ncbi:MAG TPA: hypothetical protein VLA51_12095 [Paracoccaceae bacterium]|nr:hypothetical protein [Paracoccaceae bacterium]